MNLQASALSCPAVRPPAASAAFHPKRITHKNASGDHDTRRPFYGGGLGVIFCPRTMHSPSLLPRTAVDSAQRSFLTGSTHCRGESPGVRSAPRSLRTVVAVATGTKITSRILGLCRVAATDRSRGFQPTAMFTTRSLRDQFVAASRPDRKREVISARRDSFRFDAAGTSSRTVTSSGRNHSFQRTSGMHRRLSN